jgi:hypothetical protein
VSNMEGLQNKAALRRLSDQKHTHLLRGVVEKQYVLVAI